jgi:hypothetical protein
MHSCDITGIRHHFTVEHNLAMSVTAQDHNPFNPSIHQKFLEPGYAPHHHGFVLPHTGAFSAG